MLDPCLSPWTYEKKVGAGWLYNEPDLLFNDAEFDTFPVYYNNVGRVTSWTDENIIDICGVSVFAFMDGTTFQFMDGTNFDFNSPPDCSLSGADSVWNYEKRLGNGWLYNEAGMLFNDTMFDGFNVYYNRLGDDTHWTYEQTIDGCVPVPYQFMDSSNFLFMDGTNFDFN